VARLLRNGHHHRRRLRTRVSILNLLSQYLGPDVDQTELVAIAQAALAKRIRDLKLAIAEAVVQARACALASNLSDSDQALRRARQLQQEYHYFCGEWTVLSQSGAGSNPLETPAAPSLDNP